MAASDHLTSCQVFWVANYCGRESIISMDTTALLIKATFNGDYNITDFHPKLHTP